MKKASILVLFVICVLLIEGCEYQVTKKEDIVEIVKKIVLKELQLRKLQISYDEFLKETEDIHFDEYIEFINDEDILFGFRNENNEIVEYKVKDTIGISDEELRDLRELMEAEIEQNNHEIKLEKIELYVSDIYDHDDSKYVFAKRVFKLSAGRDLVWYYWFNFKVIDNQEIIYGYNIYPHDVYIKRYTSGENINFEKYYEYTN